MAKVLLVEDDNNLREIYEARLQAEGYEISSAQDGEQALVVAKQFKPDLIISDVMMPKISGFEMLDILRNTEGLQHTRVIMLTALGQAEDKSRADSLGADRYLVKSQVTLEDIVKAAHEILDGDDAASTATVAAAVEPVAPAQVQTAAVEPVAMPVATPPANPAPEPTNAPASEPASVSEPPVAPTQPAEPTTTPDPSGDPIATAAIMNPVDSDAVQADQTDAQLMEEATQSLAGAAPETDPSVSTDVAELPVEPESDDAATEEVVPADEAASSIRKKVIEPINTDPKPDINELLAREEAAAITTPSAPEPSPVVASEPEPAPVAPPISPAEVPADTESPITHQPGDSFVPQSPQSEPVSEIPSNPETPAASAPVEAPPTTPTANPGTTPTDPNDPDSIAL